MSRQAKRTSDHDRADAGLTLRTAELPGSAPSLGKSRVAKIRNELGMSQAVFASYLNVPTKTLQSWEHGARAPKAGEARLLQLFEAAPDETKALLERVIDRGPKKRSKTRS